MPHIEDQTYQEILDTYSDTHTQAGGGAIDVPEADVIAFFGDNEFVDRLKRGVLEFGNFDGRNKINALVILAKQKALEELHKDYSPESLVNLTDREANPAAVKARMKEILEDLISDPELEQEKDEKRADYENRVKEAKKARFYGEFFKTETDRLTGKLVNDFQAKSRLSDSEFSAHMKPFRAIIDGLFDAYNQELIPSINEEDLPDYLDTEAKIQLLGHYNRSKNLGAAAADQSYTSVQENMEPAIGNLTSVIVNAYKAKYTRDHFEASLRESNNADGMEKRNASQRFDSDMMVRENNLNEISFDRNGLLAHLTSEERIIFTLDPKIRANLTFEEGPDNRVDVFYQGINLQVHTPANEIAPGEDLQKLKDAIEGAYTVHRIEAKLDAVRDLRGESLKRLAEGLEYCEEELQQNSLFYKHFSNYGGMQDAVGNFRKYIKRLSKKDGDLTQEEREKLSEHLEISLRAVNTYLEGKNALNSRTDFKKGAETARIGAARMLGNLLEQTADTLNKAYTNTEKEKRYEKYRHIAENHIKYAEEHATNFRMNSEERKEFLSKDRYYQFLEESEERAKAGDHAKKNQAGSNRISPYPFEYMIPAQRVELYDHLSANRKELKLTGQDMQVLADSIKRLSIPEKKKAARKPQPVKKAAEGGNILPENNQNVAPRDPKLDEVLNIDAIKIDENFKQADNDYKLFYDIEGEINEKIRDCGEDMSGYKILLRAVKQARKRLYDHLSQVKMYNGYADDMLILELYAESKHGEEENEKKEDVEYSKKNINTMLMRCNSQEDFTNFLRHVNQSEPFQQLILNTTPTRKPKGQIVTNTDNAMKAMRSFLFEDGAETIYQRAVFIKKKKEEVAKGKKKVINTLGKNALPIVVPRSRSFDQ